MRELIPGLSHVAVLATPAPTATFARQETEAAARLLGIRVQALIIQQPEVIDQHRSRLIELAAMRRLPARYHELPWVEAGGLMFYTATIDTVMRLETLLRCWAIGEGSPSQWGRMVTQRIRRCG
jgi:hypothetical protein